MAKIDFGEGGGDCQGSPSLIEDSMMLNMNLIQSPPLRIEE